MQGNMVFNRAPSPIGDKRNLSPNFVPSDYDVICGKGTFLLQICVLFYPHWPLSNTIFAGKSCFNHPGNKSFRKLVGLYLDGYAEATTKLEKSAIVSSIIQTVRTQNPGGGFVKLDTPSGVWQEVGDHLAREKVGQTIRDALHSQYRSSTKAKKIRRQAEQAIASDTMTMISNMHCQISSKIDDLQSKITNTRKCKRAKPVLYRPIMTVTNQSILLSRNGSTTLWYVHPSKSWDFERIESTQSISIGLRAWADDNGTDHATTINTDSCGYTRLVLLIDLILLDRIANWD